jgi:hypothetical protein
MTAKEYPEYVVGQASVYRLNTHELTVEFSYSRQFKAEYLSCLEIGQQVRVPIYTTPPSVDALIAEIVAVGVNNHMAIQAILDNEMTTLLEAAKAVRDAQAVKQHLQNTIGATLYIVQNLDEAIEALCQAVQDTVVYTPLTKEEIFKLSDSWLENNKPSKIGWATTLERAVIERLGMRWPE